MALWFWRGVRRGIVTTRYPARADGSAATLPTPPAFDASQLTPELVQQMIDICPSRALELAEGQLVLDLGRCTACQRCLEVAGPAGHPSQQFELAARDLGQLRLCFPLEGPK
jgi:ferredoxin-like protein FixX